MPDELTQEEQNEKDRKARKASYKVTLAAVTAVLDNSDGLTRLKAISDEEWAETQAKDDEPS